MLHICAFKSLFYGINHASNPPSSFNFVNYTFCSRDVAAAASFLVPCATIGEETKEFKKWEESDGNKGREMERRKGTIGEEMKEFKKKGTFLE